MAAKRVDDDDTISDGLFATPTKPGAAPSDRVGIDARSNITRLVGSTPLVFLNNVTRRCNATVVCKLEDRNPSSGLADRVALAIVTRLEEEKRITPGRSTLVEPTCGSGGLGLALVGAARGYKVVCVMLDSVPLEKRVLAKAYGAEIVLTPSSKGVKGAIFKAQQLVEQTPHAVLCNPWEDETNVGVHRETTGMEIWEGTRGLVDVFVAPVGTGGTITGVAQCLKVRNPACKVVAVEPSESAVLSGGKPGAHRLQGMGPGFVPPLLNLDLVDEFFTVSSEQGAQTARTLASKEGILAGPSSGAAVFAALEIAKRPDMHGKLVVTLVASSGEHYLTTLYEDLRRQCQSLPVCRDSEFKAMPKEKPKVEKTERS
eukprot:EG_transcript_16158